MINNISLTTVWVEDIDESKALYIDELGLEERDDVRLVRLGASAGAPSATRPEIDVAQSSGSTVSDANTLVRPVRRTPMTTHDVRSVIRLTPVQRVALRPKHRGTPTVAASARPEEHDLR